MCANPVDCLRISCEIKIKGLKSRHDKWHTHSAVVVSQCGIGGQHYVLLSKELHISESLWSVIHVNL